jgi:hypothetical protein
VAQRGEPERRVEASGFERGMQPVVHQPVPERGARRGVSEHERVRVRLSLAGVVGAEQAVQPAGDLVGHRHGPFGAPGLRRGEHLLFAVPRAPDADAGVREVDAAPVEPLQPPDPQSRHGGGQLHRPVDGLQRTRPGGIDERLDLVFREAAGANPYRTAGWRRCPRKSSLATAPAPLPLDRART